MRLDVVTIFPEYLEPLNVSLVGKARARGQLNVHVHDLRSWTYDRHNTVDDTPYGGGAGMVMTAPPIVTAVEETVGADLGRVPVLVLSASGRRFDMVGLREFRVMPSASGRLDRCRAMRPAIRRAM